MKNEKCLVVCIVLLIIINIQDGCFGADDTDIRILVLLPSTDNSYKLPFGYEVGGGAVLSALEQIKNQSLLPGYNLVADYGDTRCSANIGIGVAHAMISANNYSAIIGPQCSAACRPVARLAAYMNIAVFSGVCDDADMENKDEFKTLTRYIGTFEMVSNSVYSFMERYNWKRVSIIAEMAGDILWWYTKKNLDIVMERKNVTVAKSSIVTTENVDKDMEKVLKDSAQVSRVILLAVRGPTLRKIMLWAHDHDLTNGEYVFLCINYYKSVRLHGSYDWKQNDDRDEDAHQAYKSLFFFMYYNQDNPDEYEWFKKDLKKRSAEDFNFFYTEEEEVPYPVYNVYEATYLLGVSFSEIIKEGGDLTAVDGQNVSKRLWGRSFPSIIGGVTLNKNGDRAQAYMISHMQDITAGKMETVAYYFTINQSLELLANHLTWPGKSPFPPKDSPLCGYDNEFCVVDEKMRLVTIFGAILGATFFLVFLSVFLLGFVYRKFKLAKEISDMQWRVNLSEVLMDRKSRASRLTSLTSMSINSFGDYGQQFTRTGIYKGLTIAMKSVNHIKNVDLRNKTLLLELKQIYDMSHPNVNRFVGACIEENKIYLLTEYCSKGSLQDLLENEDITLDWTFKFSLINDIIQGLLYVHGSPLKFHGNLKSSNCLVDSRFVLKLADFGVLDWHRRPNRKEQDLLWTSPELLDMGIPSYGSQKADIYSFGIILQEIIYRQGVFYLKDFDNLDAIDIIKRVRSTEEPPFRPFLDHTECSAEIAELTEACWEQQPQTRPTLTEIKTVVYNASGRKGTKTFNILDNLLSRMEQYANNLESLVEDRTDKYLEEKKKAEDLLHRLLPVSVAKELQDKGSVVPVSYKSVTIYFSDIVEFTPLCSDSTPLQVVNLLNDLYTLFDGIIATFDVYKVETIGDAYMAVSGLPRLNGEKHVTEISSMALTLLHAVQTGFKIAHKPKKKLMLRIGIHTGSCVAAVVGLTMPRYCLFGDTVNTASRMESTGEALKIHISSATNDLLSKHGGFGTLHRGEICVKGKGTMNSYWLVSGPQKMPSSSRLNGHLTPC